MAQFVWNPESYLALMAEEIVDYLALQGQLVAASLAVPARAVLDLGCGSGETARRVLAAHPDAQLVGIDASADMLAAAGRALEPTRVSLRRQRLQDALPRGPYDLVVSALAVHHLDGSAKADLFRRATAQLRPGGRLVLADLVVPDWPEDAYTRIDWVEDLPSTAADQLDWLDQAGCHTRLDWAYRDLAVLVADKPANHGR